MSKESDIITPCVENDVQTKIFTVQKHCGRPVGPIELFNKNVKKCFPAHVAGYGIPVVGKVDQEDIRIRAQIRHFPKLSPLRATHTRNMLNFPIKLRPGVSMIHSDHDDHKEKKIARNTDNKQKITNQADVKKQEPLVVKQPTIHSKEPEPLRENKHHHHNDYEDTEHEKRYKFYDDSNHDDLTDEVFEEPKEKLIIMYIDEQDISIFDQESLNILEDTVKIPGRVNKHLGSVKYRDISTRRITKPTPEKIKLPQNSHQIPIKPTPEYQEHCNTCRDSHRYR